MANRPASTIDALERRAAPMSDGSINGRHFTGHAAVFAQTTTIGNPFTSGFVEKVNRHAFDKALRDSDTVMVDSHDPGKPLAHVSAGTLTLRTDNRGLSVDAPNLVHTSYADDLIANVAAGNIRGMSFGFEMVADDWTTGEIRGPDGGMVTVQVRELLEVRLPEVSPTAFPAYTGTDADIRSAHRSSVTRGRCSSKYMRRREEMLAAWYGLPKRHGFTVAHARLRQEGLAALYGFPSPK